MAEDGTMKSNSLPITTILLLAYLNTSKMNSQSQSLATRNLDSLAKIFNMETSKLTSPALEHRKQVRREMQRGGYSNILSDVLMNDGSSALISYVKTKIQIEYSISHRPLLIIIPIERGEGKTWSIPLQDNWTFPANPWKK